MATIGATSKRHFSLSTWPMPRISQTPIQIVRNSGATLQVRLLVTPLRLVQTLMTGQPCQGFTTFLDSTPSTWSSPASTRPPSASGAVRVPRALELAQLVCFQFLIAVFPSIQRLLRDADLRISCATGTTSACSAFHNLLQRGEFSSAKESGKHVRKEHSQTARKRDSMSENDAIGCQVPRPVRIFSPAECAGLPLTKGEAEVSTSDD